MRAEQKAMLEWWPATEGRRVLDLACGTGRYTKLLAAGRPAELVAVDFCEPMLAQVSGARRVRASMMHLPFDRDAFDIVICGLAIGHATDVGAWMTEVAPRVGAGRYGVVLGFSSGGRSRRFAALLQR
jgi:ubiquinone/menaquinone biosynthesis C-methylase UbiE